MKFPSIKEVAEYDDAQLADFLGQAQQRDAFKEELQELNSLTGEAREEAERMWTERMAPHVSSESLRWMKEDAIRSTKKGKELLDSPVPSDVF